MEWNMYETNNSLSFSFTLFFLFSSSSFFFLLSFLIAPCFDKNLQPSKLQTFFKETNGTRHLLLLLLFLFLFTFILQSLFNSHSWNERRKLVFYFLFYFFHFLYTVLLTENQQKKKEKRKGKETFISKFLLFFHFAYKERNIKRKN